MYLYTTGQQASWHQHVFLSKLPNDPDMKTMTNNEYTSPQIVVMKMETEAAICAMSNESLGYDDDAIIL